MDTYPDLSLVLSSESRHGKMYSPCTLRIPTQKDSSVWTKRYTLPEMPSSGLAVIKAPTPDGLDVHGIVNALEQELPRCESLNLAEENWANGGADVAGFRLASGVEEDVVFAWPLLGDVVGGVANRAGGWSAGRWHCCNGRGGWDGWMPS